MNLLAKKLQQRYQGYLATPVLWENDAVFGLNQLKLPDTPSHTLNKIIPDNLLLGKLAERFVTFELQQTKNIEVLLENVQISNQQRTIGELDCIFTRDSQPIHLEIVYKFYLYEHQSGQTELEHWIGPNRNDTLQKKLIKLKEMQLPLLFNQYTASILNNLDLKATQMQQQVCFKAQLFVPHTYCEVYFKTLNKQCLNGFYVHISQLEQFMSCKFYKPTKVDWLLEVNTQVNWLGYGNFYKSILPLIEQKTAPLCWIKHPNGTVQKFFIVWWK